MKYNLAIKKTDDELFKTFVTVSYKKEYQFMDNLCMDSKITDELMRLSLEQYDTFIPQQLFDDVVDKCKMNMCNVQMGELIFTLL